MFRVKTHIWAAVIMLAAMVSCGGNNEESKQAKLEKLKKEQLEIQKKINALEKELGAGNDDDKATTLVTATAANKSSFSHFIEVQGRIESDENVFVTPKIPNTLVTDLKVQRGDKVSKGQVLAQLDAGPLAQSIAEVRNQYELAKTIYQKQSRLWEQKIGTEVQYLTAKNNKESLEKRLATMQEQLSMYTLRSPINGVVDDVTLKLGEMAVMGMGGIRVVNAGKAKIVADVSEAYASRINQGDEVIVFFPDLNKEIKTKVRVAGKVINQLSRSFIIEMPLTSLQNEVNPNMVAVIKVKDYSNPSVITLPQNTVQKDENGTFVYLAQKTNGGHVAKKVPVKAGRSYNGQVEVLEGVKEQDMVITTGFQNVVDGQAINLK